MYGLDFLVVVIKSEARMALVPKRCILLGMFWEYPIAVWEDRTMRKHDFEDSESVV